MVSINSTAGADLEITSAIIDGTGFSSPSGNTAQAGVGLLKYGFGVLEFSGTAPNTYAGVTSVVEGVLSLNKGSGSGGVQALGGPLWVGTDNWDREGVKNAVVVRWMQDEQMPDNYSLAFQGTGTGGGLMEGDNAAVDLEQTSLLDLNGHQQGIGMGTSQWAIIMRIGADIQIGSDASGGLTGGQLTLNGNVMAESTNSFGRGSQITGGTLNLGSGSRQFDVVGTMNGGTSVYYAMPYELSISSNISSQVGADLIKSNTGGLLLSGNNSGMAGDVLVNRAPWDSATPPATMPWAPVWLRCPAAWP